MKTCPAFRRTLQALPESVDFPKSPDPSRLSDSEDAAAAFKARALAFASARSTADELGAMGGVIAALASLAAGERETPRSLSRVETLDEGKKTTKITRETVAPKTAAVNRAIDQDATRVPIEPAFGRCLACMLDVLFLPNSRPLHRAVLAAPRAFPPRARIRAEKALVSALRDRIAGARSAEASTEASGAARLRVLGVLFSVASCQPQTAVERRVVRAVAVDAAALIGEGAAAAATKNTRSVFSRATRVSVPFSSRFRETRASARRPKMTRLERDEFSFKKLELPSQARMFGAMEPGPLGAVANGFT